MYKSAEKRRTYFRTRYKERRNAALLKLGAKCTVCGGTSDLEFDHIDPSTKTFQIGSSQAVNASATRFWGEVAKCQLLCADCHVKKTAAELRGKPPGNKILTDRCGKQAGYSDGCRCAQCKGWLKLYKKKLVDSRGVRIGSLAP